mgnify:CR=1 FL=1
MNDLPFVCACAKQKRLSRGVPWVLGSQGAGSVALCLYSPICLQPHTGGTGRVEMGGG